MAKLSEQDAKDKAAEQVEEAKIESGISDGTNVDEDVFFGV